LCVLVDAMVVIKLHELGAWEQLTERCQVAASAIIVHDEALFHSRDQLGFAQKIDLPADVARGRIVELAATAQEMVDCRSRFDSVLASNLHDGEVECLALLLNVDNEAYVFCTADRAALYAMSLLGLGERCVSLESLLKSVGLQKVLPSLYTEEWLKGALSKGAEGRMYGRGFSR
jgi:hypothetical protein